MADEINSANAGQREEQSLLLEYLQIDIDGNEEKIKALKHFTTKKLPTILRVPDALHKMNEGAYTPRVVAIGPVHRGKKHLQPMEGEKLSYMHFLFDRTGNFDLTRDACVAAMLKMESYARRCYADSIVMEFDEDDKPVVKLESLKTRDEKGCADKKVRFAQMMLIDGCFMIEYFYRRYRKETDPIWLNSFKCVGVRRDLLLLENQLPFHVVDQLFRLTVQCIPENLSLPSLTWTECVLSFYYNEISTEVSFLEKKDDKPKAHLLHLLHSCYLPCDEAKKPEPSPEEKIEVINNFKYSATELDLGGIKFVHGNKNNIFDFEFRSSLHSYFCFWRRGQFKIPPFVVHDSTELLWRNFIAFEQFCPFIVDGYFTSHTFLMDTLINNAEDVKLLEKKGIIRNLMGSSEEVAHVFNNLRKNIVFDSIHPIKDCLEVVKFHKQTLPKFLVKLRRDYFSNPWTVISVVAAFVLFLLTLLQTIYSMRS